MRAPVPSLLATMLLCSLGPAQAALPPGAWNAALRYRHERVGDDAFARDASAHTARLRLGWRQPLAQGFSAWAEGEAVVELNDRFNSGANGRTAFPAVADARAFELNQFALGWKGERGEAALGRQRILLDNQRFIGNVGWRQNEQTFDALSLAWPALESLTLRYFWLDRVHRVSGDEARDPLARERDLDAHLFHGALTRAGQWSGYHYLIEDEDVAAASTRTSGLRWSGKATRASLTLGATLEFARQREHARNPLDFRHDYLLVETTLQARGLTWKLGAERLDGNGTHAFQTPLATLHAFNGWADRFLVTPADGLDDRYVGVGGSFTPPRLGSRLDWSLAWHDFDAARGDAAYGREWDASLGFGLGKGWTALAKFADYRSDGHGRDARKLWLQLEWTH